MAEEDAIAPLDEVPLLPVPAINVKVPFVAILRIRCVVISAKKIAPLL
jgi:hypothetical protein